MISKAQNQAVKSAIKSSVNSCKVGNGIWTVTAHPSEKFNFYKCEDFGKGIREIIETAVPGIRVNIVETRWMDSETFPHHLAKFRLAEEAELSQVEETPGRANIDQIAFCEKVEPIAEVAQAEELPMAESEKPAIDWENFPGVTDAKALFLWVAAQLGGSEEGNFRGSLQTSLDHEEKANSLAVDIYKAIKQFCKTARATYRQRKNGQFTITISAGPAKVAEAA